MYDTIKNLVSGSFAGGTAIYGMTNTGVALAPFHDTEADITDDVKATLEQIETALAQGTLKTGVNSVTGELIAGEAPEPGSCILTAPSGVTPVATTTAP